MVPLAGRLRFNQGMPAPLDDGLVFRPHRRDDEPAIRLLVFSILESYGLQPDPTGTDADLFDIDAHYGGRGGWFQVIENAAGEIVGSVGLYRDSSEVCELRKMYLHPSVRGRGLGRRLLADALQVARELAFRKVYLETASALKEAVTLYEQAGFTKATTGAHASRADLVMEMAL